MIKIMKLQIEHIDSIAELRRLQENETGNSMAVEYINTYKHWLKEHLNKDFIIYGAFDDDKLVSVFGHNILTKRGYLYSYICGLYTLPEYRSKGCQSKVLPLLKEDQEKNFITYTELLMDSPTPNVASNFYTNKLGLEFFDSNYSLLVTEPIKVEKLSAELRTEKITKTNIEKYISYYLNYDKEPINLEKSYIEVLTKKIESGENVSYALYKNDELISIISIDIQTYIPHPINISGKTAVIEMVYYKQDKCLISEYKTVLNNILDELAKEGIIYYKGYATNFNCKIFTDLGFSQVKNAMKTKLD